ncbi:MAG: M48 family metallopeptidase [Tannerella sp.]|jgi:predicted metal-dependent hydrolase|nr:M48 family metallopeptidase [Tannerella sp.]
MAINKFFDENTELQTLTFSLRIIRHQLQNFYSSLKDGVLTVSCPAGTDFSAPAVQVLMGKIVTASLRAEAKRVLPVRLKTLADEHGFVFKEVKIKNMRSRWGSCSSRKNINLSLRLMMLPQHLVDYVLLHELCHTVEMNHGVRFWSLMDKVTGNNSKRLRKEMKVETLRATAL